MLPTTFLHSIANRMDSCLCPLRFVRTDHTMSESSSPSQQMQPRILCRIPNTDWKPFIPIRKIWRKRNCDQVLQNLDKYTKKSFLCDVVTAERWHLAETLQTKGCISEAEGPSVSFDVQQDVTSSHRHGPDTVIFTRQRVPTLASTLLAICMKKPVSRVVPAKACEAYTIRPSMQTVPALILPSIAENLMPPLPLPTLLSCVSENIASSALRLLHRQPETWVPNFSLLQSFATSLPHATVVYGRHISSLLAVNPFRSAHNHQAGGGRRFIHHDVQHFFVASLQKDMLTTTHSKWRS